MEHTTRSEYRISFCKQRRTMYRMLLCYTILTLTPFVFLGEGKNVVILTTEFLSFSGRGSLMPDASSSSSSLSTRAGISLDLIRDLAGWGVS